MELRCAAAGAQAVQRLQDDDPCFARLVASCSVGQTEEGFPLAQIGDKSTGQPHALSGSVAAVGDWMPFGGVGAIGLAVCWPVVCCPGAVMSYGVLITTKWGIPTYGSQVPDWVETSGMALLLAIGAAIAIRRAVQWMG
jgi:hypothetical protein